MAKVKKEDIKKVVLAYSGGLDTSIIIPWLKENYNNPEIIAVSGDVGQGTELDGLEEARLADKKYGSTKQGIAPFYSDKYQKKTIMAGELFFPEGSKRVEIIIHLFRGIFYAHAFPFVKISFSQQEEQAHFFPWLQRELFLQAATVIAPLFKTPAAYAALDRQRVALRAVRAEKAVTQAVKTVRHERGGEELPAVFFIVEIIFDDAVLIAAAGGIQAHLKVLVIHGDLMKAEFQIGKDGERAQPAAAVAKTLGRNCLVN